MSSFNALVLLQPTHWHIAVKRDSTWQWSRLALAAESSIEQRVSELADLLRQAGMSAGTLLVGLPADRCMTGIFNSTDLPANDYTTRLFRFEPLLPLPAEQAAAEFVDVGPADDKLRTFGIAAERAWLESHVTAIESQGFIVDAIVPTSIMIAAQTDASGIDVCLFREPGDDPWQLVLSESGRLTQWLSLPTPDVLPATLRRLSLRGHDVEVIRTIGGSIAPNEMPAGVKVLADSQSAQQHVISQADRWASGRALPFDLRRRALPAEDRFRLHRRSIDTLLIGMAVMLVLLAAGFWIRAAAYTNTSQRNQQLMMTRFHEALPGWPTPSNFRAVVASERRRLAPDAEGQSSAQTALSVLTRVLQPLSVDEKVGLNDLSFAPLRFDLSGSARQYESIQPLDAAVRKSGMEIAPVQAHKLPDNSWQFTLSGRLAPPKGVDRQ